MTTVGVCSGFQPEFSKHSIKTLHLRGPGHFQLLMTEWKDINIYWKFNP